MALPKGYGSSPPIDTSEWPIGILPSPLIGRSGLKTGIPFFMLIDSRVFGSIFYYLFFLQDRMVFVVIDESSFLENFLLRRLYSHRQVLRPYNLSRLFMAVFLLLGVAFIALVQTHAVLGLLLLIGAPTILIFMVLRYRSYLNRISYPETSREYRILSVLSEKDFEVNDLMKLPGSSVELLYSEVNSVSIKRIEYNRFRRKDTIGLLIFELNASVNHRKDYLHVTNNGLSDGIKIYNIPVGEDITLCRTIVNNFMPGKLKDD